jgi:hypothetical protein
MLNFVIHGVTTELKGVNLTYGQKPITCMPPSPKLLGLFDWNPSHQPVNVIQSLSLNCAPRHDGLRGSGVLAARFLYLGTVYCQVTATVWTTER